MVFAATSLLELEPFVVAVPLSDSIDRQDGIGHKTGLG